MRVVLVTGGARGLGREVSKLFLAKGDIVYINYNLSQDLALELARQYDKAIPIKADVSSEEEVKEMLAKIEAEQGHLDVLVNNAAISDDNEMEKKTKKSFQRVLEVNLIGAFLVAKYAKRIMNGGTIINVTSTNAIDTYYPYSMDYDASKAGLISLTHNLAVDLAPKIRVNAVAAGWMNTSMNENMDSAFKKAEEEKILLKRFAEAIEVARVILFLASEEASYINGSVIRVDGGK